MGCMSNIKPYDCSEKGNKTAFDRLPGFFQLFIKQTQQKIQEAVEKSNPGRKITATSGFRSHSVNIKAGGVTDSLHLFGLARDFRYYPDEPLPFIVPVGFVCIKSKNCWHVAYKRGL